MSATDSIRGRDNVPPQGGVATQPSNNSEKYKNVPSNGPLLATVRNIISWFVKLIAPKWEAQRESNAKEWRLKQKNGIALATFIRTLDYAEKVAFTKIYKSHLKTLSADQLKTLNALLQKHPVSIPWYIKTASIRNFKELPNMLNMMTDSFQKTHDIFVSAETAVATEIAKKIETQVIKSPKELKAATREKLHADHHLNTEALEIPFSKDKLLKKLNEEERQILVNHQLKSVLSGLQQEDGFEKGVFNQIQSRFGLKALKQWEPSNASTI
jgi:hypothetical protein